MYMKANGGKIMTRSEILASYKQPLILLGGIILGAVIGVVFGKQATVLKPIGDIFINLMFTIVAPLVFVSIANAVGSMLNMNRLGKILGSLIFTFIATGIVASVLVLIVVNIWSPAASTSITMQAAGAQKAVSISEMIVNTLTVNDFSGLMSKSNMMPIIIAAIAFGFATATCSRENNVVGRLLDNLNTIIMKLVDMIMMFAPVGLGAYFANLIGELGPQLIGDYARTMLIYYPMCIVYGVVFYPLYAYFAAGSLGVKRMLAYIFNPAVTAFATQSSVATLPVNLEACKKIGVPEDIGNIVLPMGATMHMDGSVLSSIVKIAFLFGVFNIPFEGAGTYAMAILVSILSAFVLSGAPGGGLVGEMIIVSLFNFPPEAFPIIATIGFLVDPAATCLNATGDTIAAMIITKFVEGKSWLVNRLEKGDLAV